MSVITAAVDLRSLFGTARNQGSRPTCLAFAASDTHAALRSGWVPLSCEYAFYQAQRRVSFLGKGLAAGWYPSVKAGNIGLGSTPLI
jgi:hypothetical protein